MHFRAWYYVLHFSGVAVIKMYLETYFKNLDLVQKIFSIPIILMGGNWVCQPAKQ